MTRRRRYQSVALNHADANPLAQSPSVVVVDEAGNKQESAKV